MAYNIVKSDGTPLATIADGQTNNTATSLTLVGKNFAGYGTFLNENFVKLLENFANSTEPANKKTGQLWYQTSTKLLQVYNGTAWKSVSGAQSLADEPTSKVAGDLWFDSVNQQLKVWSGAGWVVIGPSFTSTTGTSGAVADTVIDSSQFSHVVVKFFVQNQLVAVLSKDAAFQPATTIPGFPTIKPGLNLARGTSPELVFYENANNASYLGGLAAAQYLTKDNALLTSKLVIRNDDGVELADAAGTVTNFQMKYYNNNIELISLVRSNGFVIRTAPENAGGALQPVLVVDKVSGLITVLADPTDPAGVATKNYVDTRDNNTRTMLQNNVAAINSNVSVVSANSSSSYSNVRTIQEHLGFKRNGPGSADDVAYSKFTTNDSFAGNLITLWANLAAVHSNTLSKGGSGGTVDSSMFSNVRLLQGKVSSLETDALRRDGALTVTGTLTPSSANTIPFGATNTKYSVMYSTALELGGGAATPVNALDGAIHGLTSINYAGSRGAGDPIVIKGNPVIVMGNIAFNDNYPGAFSNTSVGVASSMRVTGTLRVDGDIRPTDTDDGLPLRNIGTTLLKWNNIYVKTVNAETITLSGSGGLSSTAAASFGALTINGDIAPNTDLTYDLGNSISAGDASNKRWVNVNGTNFISDAGVSLRATGSSKGLRWEGSTSGEADIGTVSMKFGDVYAGEFVGDTVKTTTAGIFRVSGAGALDIGEDTTAGRFNNVYATLFKGTATTARYADLAERFEADAVYAPGTVVRIGGTKEITLETDDASTEVFGVVSTNPAYLMNESAGENDTHPPVALAGRVPVRVVGAVRKGQRLVSAGNGCARAAEPGEATPENVIGRALADKESSDEGLVTAIVKLSM